MLNDRSSWRRVPRPWLACAAAVGLLPFQLVERPVPSGSAQAALVSPALQQRDAAARDATAGVATHANGITGGVAGGIREGVPGGIPGGVNGGVRGGVEGGLDMQSTPPAPPVPPVPPVPPTPPPPPPDDWAYRYGEGPWHDIAAAWVFIAKDHRMSSANQAQMSRAEALREGDAPLFWFKRDEQEYVIRDAVTLQQIDRALEQHRLLGAAQGEVGGKQGELGTEMGRLGARQGELGAKQAELAAHQAALTAEELKKVAEELKARQAGTVAPQRNSAASKADRQQLEHEMQRLSNEMQSLAAEQEKLGREMEKLAHEQVRMAERQRETSARAAKELSATLDRAIKDGKATPVK